ncbi:MAG: ankyrin repeat domain-containing protein [Planctomycetaceae bacterium]|jgi:hypothetical protein|nr:ankyrin repeat domain-containing protein [Planctomycetaceae bacterium]
MKIQKTYFGKTLLFCIVSLFFCVECRLCKAEKLSFEEVMQLFEACKDGNFREFAANNPEAVKKTFNFGKDGLSTTLLHLAASDRQTEFVKTLLEFGANPATKDSDNYIPIVYAVVYQEKIDAEEVIRYLVANCPGNNPIESCVELLKSCLEPPIKVQRSINATAVVSGLRGPLSEVAQVQSKQIYSERSKVVQKCILTIKVATDGVDLKKYSVKKLPPNIEEQKENKKR